MLHSDQIGWAGQDGAAKGTLAELARQIEETQRRQGETLGHIVGRLRAMERDPGTAGAQPRERSAPAQRDEPWDADSAEALMQTYEKAGEAGDASWRARALSYGAHQQEWIGDRFHDVTARIKRALADLKPGSTMVLIEARLDEFQRHISSALEDVVRRSDMAGLRLIEAHVAELGQKLEVLEQHVSRLNGIEADVRSVMEQVSDERIAKLLDYDARFAADLEAVAVRAAEEVHARFGQSSEQAHAEERRHEELRAMIEESIQDRRQAHAEAASLVSGLTGRVDQQADRYDEIKALLEQAIQEQRQSEQTAFSMLDTLQQGLVSVLDRIDALEQQPPAAAWAAPRDVQAEASVPALEPIEARPFGTRQPADRSASPAAFEGYAPVEAERAAPVEVPAAFDDTGRADVVRAPEVQGSGEDSLSSIERLRREFIADARRAKLKAAANRAEAVAQATEPPKRGPIAGIEATRAALTQAVRTAPTAAGNSSASGSSRLFGASPKLIATALAIVVMINGGLLLLNRKNQAPSVPEVTIEHQQSPATDGAISSPPASGQGGEPGAVSPEAGPRSNLDDEGAAVPGVEPASAPGAVDGQMLTPYGVIDDVLNPPSLEAESAEGPAMAPRGTTVATSNANLPDALVADVYQQQVLANLSGKVGDLAARQTPGALLPEKSGRVEAAFTPADIEPGDGDGATRSSALDLPPATVGPLSLRLAAANGDASAEFEVAARLAEGKGTAQDFAEALRWYQRSASKGFAQAQYRLGTLYERGLGVAKDPSRARVWYGRAAEQGNVKSMHNLAVLTVGGAEGEPDYRGAMPWFQKAAEHGLADSQYNLAVLLENGLGGSADRVAALKWYSLAAKAGDGDARARRDALKASLPAKDVKSAEAMVAAYKPRPAIALVNDARAAGEDWKKRARNDSNG